MDKLIRNLVLIILLGGVLFPLPSDPQPGSGRNHVPPVQVVVNAEEK
jgi:hypothetical protein